MPYLRQILLGTALLLTLAAAVFGVPGKQAADGAGESAASEPAKKLRTPIAAPSAVAEPTARNATPARLKRSMSNPFAAVSWAPPPPVQVVRVVVPKAPPLPFVYLGKMLDGKAVTAFVSMGGQTHLLHGGDTLRDYRVEAISAKEISFVYLPLNEKQRLPFGSEN